MARGVPYASVRDDIAPGDLGLLHHDFVASWYGLQIEAVQRATGFFAHIFTFDRIVLGGEERVVADESVVPNERCVLVSNTAEQGFWWISMNRQMLKVERDSWWSEIGSHEFVYDKLGAIEAGDCFLRGVQMPAAEAENPRRWCAKAVALHALKSGLDLGRSYVPTEMANVAQNMGGQLRYVRMQ